MPIFLFDTGVASLPVNPAADPKFVSRFERVSESGALSCTVLCELLYGVFRRPKGRRRTELLRYVETVLLPRVPTISYDRAAAEWHAAERARLEAIGLTPPFADGQIAAVAAVNDLTLVTRNERDFAHFEGLRVEGW